MDYTTGNFDDINDIYQSTTSGDYWYHSHPPFAIDVNWRCDRDSVNNPTTKWSVTITTWQRSDYASYSSYNGETTVEFFVNGVKILSGVIFDGDGIRGHTYTYDLSVTDVPLTLTGNSVNILLRGICSQDCDHYDYEGNLEWDEGIREDDYNNFGIPPYTSYTPATVQIKNITPTSTVSGTTYIVAKMNYNSSTGTYTNTDQFTETYKVVKNGNSLAWNRLKFYANNTNPSQATSPDNNPTPKYAIDFTTSPPDNQDTTGQFTLPYTSGGSTIFTPGTYYKAMHWISDNQNNIKSAEVKNVYIYQVPTMASSLSIKKSVQNAAQDNAISFNAVNNATIGFETTFATRYRYKIGSSILDNDPWLDMGAAGSGWTKTTTNLSWIYSITAANMRTLVPYSAANDGATVNLQIERYSPSALQESFYKPTTSFKVYYRPRKGVTSVNLKKNNSSGSAIAGGAIINNDSSFTGVYLNWSFDDTTADAGYTQGYRIRLYNANNDVVHTYYTTSKNYPIPKADIPKLQNTYIDITPYYANGQTNPGTKDTNPNYVYYNGTITKLAFVYIMSNLVTPVIEYPVASANWINLEPRVCFKLPEDNDFADIGETIANYRYKDIQLKVVNNSRTTTLSYTSNSTCFSCDNLKGYQKGVIIYPNIVANTISAYGTCTLQVRVQKYYGDQRWSDWSSVRTFTMTQPSYSVMDGNTTLKYIRASHFNNIRDIIIRASNTYGVNNSSISPTAQANTTKITQSQYTQTALFGIILEIKTKVNGYGTFNNNTIKFDNAGDIPSTNFDPQQEYVTEAAQGTNGRNYMQIAFNRIIKLI